MDLKMENIEQKLSSLKDQNIKDLDDCEIYNILKNDLNIPIGPVVKSTRTLYENIVQKAIKNVNCLNYLTLIYTEKQESDLFIQNKLKFLEYQDLNDLDNIEIYDLLKYDLKIPIGPVVKTTRVLYENIIKKAIQNLNDLKNFASSYIDKHTKSKSINESNNTSINNGSFNKFRNTSNLIDDISFSELSEIKYNKASFNENFQNSENFITNNNRNSLINIENCFKDNQNPANLLVPNRNAFINNETSNVNFFSKSLSSTPIFKERKKFFYNDNENKFVQKPVQSYYENKYALYKENLKEDCYEIENHQIGDAQDEIQEQYDAGIVYQTKINNSSDSNRLIQISQPTLISQRKPNFIKNEFIRKRNQTSFNEKRSKWSFLKKMLIIVFVLLVISFIIAIFS